MDESNAASGDRPHQPLDEHPIQQPESIQPHGVLLALDESDGSLILQVSDNTEELLGVQPQQLVGASLDCLLDTSQIHKLRQCVPLELHAIEPIKLAVQTPSGVVDFDSFVHRTRAAVLLEMEPAITAAPESFLSVHALVRGAIARMQRAASPTELLNCAVNEIRHLTNFDRVLVYRFDEAGAGEVMAEAKQFELEPYQGLHFPAQDIPEWVRAFYGEGKLRTVPNMQATPAGLVPPFNLKTGETLDLSASILRSPDPCCVEYYSNMGMSATLVASLLKDQILWGLIACHHPVPKRVSYEVRAACEFLVQMTASELANKLRQENLNQQSRHQALRSELIASISQADNFIDALIRPEERLLTLVNATGAAICLRHELTLVGATPAQGQVEALIGWADAAIQDNLFQTPCLSEPYPEAAAFKTTASGLLLMRIARAPHYLILWFRPEVLQTVNWGGKPDVELRPDESGKLQLCPRASFELWQETVHATSLPWRPYEINSALELRNAIVGIVLKKADDLAKLNREFQRSNRELAAFAYAAAHDLKEPLRGIYNYATVLREDFAQALGEEGQEYLSEIQVFSQRMETLINALLRISQLRQTQLKLQTTSLDALVKNAVDVVRASQPENRFEVRIPRSLPRIQCDPVLMSEVFRNLISNAIKYNDHSEKWVEIGYQEIYDDTVDSASEAESTAQAFYVRDNGIGIREGHLSEVFKLFKRLHPQGHYDGGVGVGLAVVNQIIERHGGRIWIESTPGQGSTFYFSLEPEDPIYT